MKKFKYSIKNKNGENMEGTIMAEHRKEVITRLRHQDCVVVNIKECNELFHCGKTITWTMKNIINFSFQMAMLMDAGVSLHTVLSIMGSSKNKKWPMQEITEYIHRGMLLSDALQTTGFPIIAINLLQVGENTGNLSAAFKQIHLYYTRQKEMREKMWQISLYPLFIFSMLIVFIIGGIFFIFPTFVQIFEMLQVPLPKSIQYLLGLAQIFTLKNSFLALFLFIGIKGGIQYFIKQGVCRLYLDKYIWLLGRKIVLYSGQKQYRFFFVMSKLLQAGIPLLTCLDITKTVWLNRHLEEKIDNVKISIAKGDSIATAFQKEALCNFGVHELLSVGNISGELDIIFAQIADYYEKEVMLQFKRVEILLEPILMGLIGIIIGWIVLTVMLPLFNTIGSIDRM